MTLREWTIGALLAMALGIPAPASAQASEMIERWLFLGRRTESGWQPPSVSVNVRIPAARLIRIEP